MTFAFSKQIVTHEASFIIMFYGFVVSKHFELRTGISIRKFLDESKKIIDEQIFNQITYNQITLKAQPTEEMKGLILKLNSRQ